MRKIMSATLACGALTLGLAGCNFSNLLPTPGSSTNPVSNVAPTPDAAALLQANLKEAAAFSSNLKEAAAFGAVTNGPLNGLKEAAALTIQSTGPWSLTNHVFSNPSGDLVATGSASGTDDTNADVDLTVATASAFPDFVGAHIQGHFALDLTTSPFGLKGQGITITTASGSTTTFDFGLIPTTTTSGLGWEVTVPVASGSDTLYAHVQTTDDTGWVALNEDGTSPLGKCWVENGQWVVAPLDYLSATQSIPLPF